MTVTVRQVQNKEDFQTFFRFPWKLYKDYDHYIHNLPMLRRETLNKDKHAAWEYLDGDYFVAWKDNEPVGTIAAFVNPRHNDFHNENIGFFGFFECIDDQEVADALFHSAEDYLREKEVEAIRGPANFSSNEEWGLLIDSFDQDPMVLMPYNPPYYIQLVENAGFKKAMDLLAWRLDFDVAVRNLYDDEGNQARVVRAVKRAMKKNNITVRTLNKKKKQQEFATLRQIYEQAWQNNWGFVPMTDSELDDLVEGLGFLVLPEYTYFAEVDGKTVGFLLLIPNLNEVLKHVQPHPGLPDAWWLLKTLWHWKLRPKINSLRIILLGVTEEMRGIGADAAMFLSLASQMERETRFEWAEAGWILETNDAMNRLLEHFGSYVHRRHRIYEKPLGL